MSELSPDPEEFALVPVTFLPENVESTVEKKWEIIEEQIDSLANQNGHSLKLLSIYLENWQVEIHYKYIELLYLFDRSPFDIDNPVLCNPDDLKTKQVVWKDIYNLNSAFLDYSVDSFTKSMTWCFANNKEGWGRRIEYHRDVINKLLNDNFEVDRRLSLSINASKIFKRHNLLNDLIDKIYEEIESYFNYLNEKNNDSIKCHSEEIEKMAPTKVNRAIWFTIGLPASLKRIAQFLDGFDEPVELNVFYQEFKRYPKNYLNDLKRDNSRWLKWWSKWIVLTDDKTIYIRNIHNLTL